MSRPAQELRGFNSVLLPDGIARGIVLPDLSREDRFLVSYERRVLFYDVFWNADESRIIMHGPAPVDLAPYYRDMRIVARPSGKVVRAKGHHSILVQLYSVAAPAGTTHLDIIFAGQTIRVAPGRSHTDLFRGENLLFTLSKDNDLQWISDWVEFHVVHHGVTAVLVYDNGSARYSPNELRRTICTVPGIRIAEVVPTPFLYTREDSVHPDNLFWAHFLQPSVMVNMLRRYGSEANGIMNADIDELIVPLANETAFETAASSRSGTVYFRDCWIEPMPNNGAIAPYRHADFQMVAAEADYRYGPTAKWVMAPARRWLRNLRQHPYPHAIQNRPFATRHKPGTAYVAHFKGISTSWKYDRSTQATVKQALRVEPMLAKAMERAFARSI